MAPSAARNSARIAGALYLAIILGGFFAIGYVPATLSVAGDAAATAQNIVQNALLYRMGLVVHLLVRCAWRF